MIYVIYTAPWGSGHRGFYEDAKSEKKMFVFIKDLVKNHNLQKTFYKQGKWRGHIVEDFKLSVTFKKSDLWKQK